MNRAGRIKRLLPAALAAAALAVFAVTAVPLTERWLLEQPSCLAFVGVRSPGVRDDAHALDQELEAVRDAALAQGAIGKPATPQIRITRMDNSGSATSVLSATRTPTGWSVAEAAQPFDLNRGPRRFKVAPPRTLDAKTGRGLDAVIAKDCAFSEPFFAGGRPDVWFEIDLFTRYMHPDYWLVEIDRGDKRHEVVRGGPFGVTGSLAALVIKDGQGFLEPDGPMVDWNAHVKTGLPPQ